MNTLTFMFILVALLLAMGGVQTMSNDIHTDVYVANVKSDKKRGAK